MSVLVAQLKQLLVQFKQFIKQGIFIEIYSAKFYVLLLKLFVFDLCLNI